METIHCFKGEARISPQWPPIANTMWDMPDLVNIHSATIFPCKSVMKSRNERNENYSDMHKLGYGRMYIMYSIGIVSVATYHKEWQTSHRIA